MRLALSENVTPRLQPGIFDFATTGTFIRSAKSPEQSNGTATKFSAFNFSTFNFQPRFSRIILSAIPAVIVLASLFTPSARAEYVVLRSGQRLAVTGYQLVGDTYKLTLRGGSAELPASEVIAIEPEEVFQSEKKPAIEGIPFSDFIASAAKNHSVDADLIVSVITAESKFNPKAVSRKNARGLMQLLPETATRLGVTNIFDPQQNIEGGTRYLRELLDRYHGDLALTLAAYNAGPQRVEQYKTIPPYRETISYVRRVQKTYNARKSPSSAQNSSRQRATSSSATSAVAKQSTTGGSL